MRGRIAALVICTCALGFQACGQEPGGWEVCQERIRSFRFHGDFDASRSTLKRFLAANPGSAHVEEARKMLGEFEEYAEKQIKSIYENGRSFSDRRRFDLALELYTEIITRAPGAEWVTKAKEGIERNDMATEPLFKALDKKCHTLFAEWEFSEAAKIAGRVASDFAGTKWANAGRRASREASTVTEFFKSLASKVEKTAGNPKKTPFKIEDLTGWRVRGKIIKADEKGFTCLVTGAGKVYTWREFMPQKAGEPPQRFLEIIELYDISPRDQFGLAVLFLRLGLKKSAVERFKLAEADAAVGEEAEYYGALLTGNLNRVAYDFSSGLQLMDWQASGGRWRITKDELTQEAGEDKSELLLVKHVHKSKEVRFFFEITAKSTKGLISVVFTQDARNSFGFTFSGTQGYSAFANVNGGVKTVRNKNFRLPVGKKVRIRCGLKDDTFALSVGKDKMERLTLAGLGGLQGRFALRTLDAKAAFDSIVIRNRTE